jgi:hypothetical protein
MAIHPDLMALRSDPVPQRLAHEALSTAIQRWRESALMRRIESEFQSFSQGAELAAQSQLTTLFDPEDSMAGALVARLVDPLIAVLAKHPLGAVPLRHYGDDQSATLVLCQNGGSALSIQVLDPVGLSRQRPAHSVTFAPGQLHERILAGSGRARLVTLRHARPDTADLAIDELRLETGQCLHRNSEQQCRMITALDAPLVLLRLQRRAAGGAVTREYALEDGRFIAQAAARPRETRLELAAALLGRMGRNDAAPLLSAMAEEEAGQSLRWQSLKECLGLDTATGYAALCRIAARADDPLAAPAGALRAQLIESYPQLEGLA